MQWVLDLILVFLLAATLLHALRLERALGVLRRDRAALEGLITEFNDSTRQAEAGIERLRGMADGAARQITQAIDVGGKLKDDLVFLIDRGETIADRLDGAVRAGRSVEPGRASQAPSAPVAAAQPPPPSAPAPTQTVPPAIPPGSAPPSDPDTRYRSQAERDLLKALRMAK